MQTRSEEKRKKRKGLSQDQIKAILDGHIHNAMGYVGGELSEQRGLAMQYYLGEPFGNEVDGRSQVISTDVADTIEWMMPSLVRTFTATDDAFVFDPVTKEDEEAAEQETDYINYVFNKENPGFLVLYTFLKDALLQKNSIVKSYWEVKKTEEREEYVGLTEDEFMLLSQDKELEPMEYSQSIEIATDPATGQPIEQVLHNIVFKRTRVKGRAVTCNVAPENFLIVKDWNSIDLKNVPFCAEKADLYASDLLEMGIDQKTIDELPNAREVDTEEEVKRNHLDDERNNYEAGDLNDKSMRKITVYECYIRIDEDGDGIAELRKILKAGDKILIDEPVDSIPFTAMTPVILCHKFFGLSIADLVMDLQLIKSTIWRQLLDNMYLMNNGRHVIDVERVTLEDLLVSRPGGIIRARGDAASAVVPLQTHPLSPMSFSMIEYIDKVRDGRSGVSQTTMGLNDELLSNNKGDRTIDQVMTAANQRIELIARIFAETGIKSLYLRLHELVQKHQDKEKIVKLRNKWVAVNPSEWRERTSMTINVGLGAGERDRLAQAMGMVLSTHQQVIANGGEGVLVSLKNIYRAAIDLAKYSGIKNAEWYYTDPESEEAQQAMQLKQQQAEEAKQNDPARLLVQVEAEKKQVTALKNQLEHQRKAFELQQKMAEMAAAHQVEIQKLKQDYNAKISEQAIKLTELELKYTQNVPGSVV
jgi:hypothetical protein